jgi:type IV pilus assembly protein PilW
MRTHLHTRQAGFSLVELMVALVLGLILTSGVISVYITSKNTYNVNNALGAVQQHGRFAFGFMDPKVRMAGYTGCTFVKGGNFNLNAAYNTDPVYTVSSPVYGYEANNTGINGSFTVTTAINTTPPVDATKWTPNLDKYKSTLFDAIKSKVLQGSDVFMVHEMQGNPPALTGVYDDGTALYVSTSDHGVNDTSYFAVGSIAMVNNCSGTNLNIFQVTALNSGSGTLSHGTGGSLGNASGSLTGTYSTSGGNVGRLQTYAYYVGLGVDGGPALYQASLQDDGSFLGQELVSGIENMQVLYGVDTDGDKIPNNFQTADTVESGNNWGNVVSIRVALLSRSDDNSTDKAATTAPVFYMLASDPAANANADGLALTLPMDRRLRRSFVQTFSVRNALP